MSWPLYLAFKQLFPTGKRVPFFTAISVLGVALGVTILIVTLSVMGGFGAEIRRMIVETNGDITIQSRTGAIADPAAVLAAVRKTPDVVGATPYAQGVSMLLAGNRPAFPAIQGVDLTRVEEVLPLNRFIRFGSLDDLDDDSIILSAKLANELGVGLGGEVELYTPLMLERMRNDEVILPRGFKVVGLFEIGHSQLDGSLVICTLRTMQDLYGLGRSVHGISVRVGHPAEEMAVVRQLNQELPAGLVARSWQETSADFLFILRLEKNMLLFILLFIVLVASFAIASSLVTSVVRRTKEIGVLSALGGRPRQIALCFCYQGLTIGIAGTALGLALGFTAVAFRNEVIDLFERLTASGDALDRFYLFPRLPAHLETGDFIVIVAGSIVIATLASLIAAWRAARLKPSEALRSE